MTAAVSRRVDDEGLPLPPPVHGKAARWLFGHRHHLGHPGHPHRRRGAVPGRPRRVPLGRSMTELAVNAGVVLALSVALVLVRRFARLDRA